MRRKFLIAFALLAMICPLLFGCFGADSDTDSSGHENIEIYFEKDNYEIEVGDEYQLNVMFRKNNVSDKIIIWQSSDESVASVVNGLVSMHSVGYATISATSATGNEIYCYVQGVVSPISIELEFDSVTLFTSHSMDINVDLQPADCTQTQIVWTSSDSSVATANGWGENATIFASYDHPGVAMLTATTSNGLTASIVVTVKQYIHVQSVTIKDCQYEQSFTTKTLYIPYDEEESQFNLMTKVYPSNASFPEVVWTSSDISIAEVDGNGCVKLKSEGSVEITANTKDSVKDSVTLIVKKEVVATSISLHKTSLSLYEGDSKYSLVVKWIPTNVTYKKVTWSSSNENVATVEESVHGVVTPVGVGTAIITATTPNGIVASCEVVVKARIDPTSITLNKTNLDIEETKTFDLTATILPESCTHKSVAWTSSDSSIVKVNVYGGITAVGVGSAIITATTVNNLTATCEIVVSELTIRVNVIKDNEIVDVLETRRSKGYLVDLPGRDEDVTTNASLSNYFYGWFGDENYSTYLTGEERFEKDTSIYAKNVDVLTAEEVEITENADKRITKINNIYNKDVLVIPQRIGGVAINGLLSNSITADTNVKTIVFLGHFIYDTSAISNCPNLENILLYDYTNEYIVNRDLFTIAKISNCPKVKYNETNGIRYLGSFDKPYAVALSVIDNSIDVLTIYDECYSIGLILDGLSNLTQFNVEDGNKYYSSQSGILYNKAKNQIVKIPSKLSGDIVIPDTITSIDNDCFKNFTGISSVDVGGGVTTIGEYAFYGCSNLLSILGGEKITTIGNYAFANCSNLQSCQLKSIKTISRSAFKDCVALENFNFVDGVECIGVESFKNTRLQEVILPNSVTVVGEGAFNGCYRIKQMTLPFVGIQSSNDESLTKYPFGIIFGSDSYSGSTKITQYYMTPNSSYSSNENYYIPKNLNTIVITGNGVWYGAFSNMFAGVSISLNSVTNLEKNTFLRAHVDNLYLPASLASIESEAFYNASIGSVYYNGSIDTWLNVDINGLNDTPLKYASKFYIDNVDATTITSITDIPTTITSIKSYVLYGFEGLESIDLNDNMTSVGLYSFYNCSNLKFIDIPSNVTSIGNYAFTGCSGLLEITLHDGIDSIGTNAFENCQKLESIILPNTLTSFKASVFKNCSSLSNVQLSSNITAIPYEAFSGCSSLVGIDIPVGVVEIGSKAFMGCSNITTFKVQNADVVLSSEIWAGCEKLADLTVSNVNKINMVVGSGYFRYYFGDSGIPSSLKSVTVLGGELNSGAFQNCVNIETIVLENVSVIGAGAFQYCRNLTSLVINSDIEDDYYSKPILNCAGVDSTGITITFGKNVTKVPDNFLSKGGEAGIKGKITNIVFEDGSECQAIGVNAFADSDVVSIVIPASVETIGEKAFYNCMSLTDIVVNDENANYSSNNGCLYNKDESILIQFALGKDVNNFIIDSNVSAILPYAFYGANNLSQITYNSNLIEDQVKDNYIFEGIVSAFDLVIAKDVNRIPSYLFSPSQNSGANILSISFETNSLCEVIGECAFANCSTINEIDLSSSVVNIENSAFSGCGTINYNYVGSLSDYLRLEYYNLTANPINGGGNLKINSSVVTAVTIPDDITIINRYAFLNCREMQSVVLHDSIISINYGAFINCSNLVSLEIPQSAGYLVSGTLAGCSGLEKLTISQLSAGQTIGALFGDEQYSNSYRANQRYISSGNVLSVDYYVPSDLKEVNVIAGNIEYCAFENITSVDKVVLGSNVVDIENCAFYNCTHLSSIDFPQGLSSIGDSAFYNCSSLLRVDIPDGVQLLASQAFASCDILEDVNIGSSEDSVLSNIGDNAFAGCVALKSVTMYNIITIGNGAFKGCSRLKDIKMPTSLQTIGDEAFKNCLSLNSITIHSKVQTIGSFAFNGCYRLVEVYDLSSYITCVAGRYSSDTGYLSAYAMVVHDSVDTPSILYTTDNEFYFAMKDGVQYLVAYEGESSEPLLPEDKGDYVLGDYAFAYVDSITSLSLPSCVIGVGYSSLYNLNNLEYLSVTGSLQKFELWFINDCDKLDVFNFNGSMSRWLLYDFATDSENPMHYAKRFKLNNSFVTSYVIPVGITTINNYSFYNFKDLVYIDIHSGVTKLGEGAFKGCSSLCNISISSTGVVDVGRSVFEGCSSLVTFNIPTTLTSVSDKMFAGCSELTEVVFNNSITSVGDFAFADCVKMTSVYLPVSINKMGNNVFAGCSALETLSLAILTEDKDDSLGVFGNLFGTYNYGEGYKEVIQNISSSESETYYIPSTLKYVKIKSGAIVYGAFDNCEWITSVEIDDDVTYVHSASFELVSPYVNCVDGVYYIGNWAISSVAGLSGISLREKTIGVAAYAFANMSSLKTFNSVGSLRYICDNAFYYSYNLNSINLNNGIVSIGDEVFSRCINLIEVYLPSSLISLGKRVFKDTTSLSSISVASGNSKYVSVDGNLYSADKTTLIQYAVGKSSESFTILNSVTTIEEYAFYNAKVTEINFGNGLIEIKEGAFYECKNLTALDLPASLVYIRSKAFYGCSSLKSVDIKLSVQIIEELAFKQCDKLEDAQFECELWRVVDDSNEIVIPEGDFLDSGLSAKHLRSDYVDYIWVRKTL